MFAIAAAVVGKVGVSALGRGMPPVPEDTIAGLTARRRVRHRPRLTSWQLTTTADHP